MSEYRAVGFFDLVWVGLGGFLGDSGEEGLTVLWHFVCSLIFGNSEFIGSV